jgi:hypothetical protein
VKGLIKIMVLVVVTALMLALLTKYKPGSGDAETAFFGLPVVSVGQVGAHGWLALGQAATGVLVIAQAGGGVVAFVQVGVAAFFGIGQVMFALGSIAQVGVGPFFFLGQGGVGAQAAGQGVFKRRSPQYFAEMSEEFADLLRPAWKKSEWRQSGRGDA